MCTFGRPEDVVHYIGRYTHRIAISNGRLLGVEDGRVHFRYKDYQDEGRWKTACLKPEEFISRFLMHVVPDGFHRIRHFGLFANGRCKAKVTKIRQLLKADETGPCVEEEEFRLPCPKCKTGSMIPRFCIDRYGILILDLLSRFGGNLKRPAWDTS